MGSVIPFSDALDYKAVMGRIRFLWESGTVSWSKHMIERMGERNFDALDVQHAIRYGRITSHRIEGNRYKYTVSGKAVGGRSLRCVVIVLDKLILITAMP